MRTPWYLVLATWARGVHMPSLLWTILLRSCIYPELRTCCFMFPLLLILQLAPTLLLCMCNDYLVFATVLHSETRSHPCGRAEGLSSGLVWPRNQGQSVVGRCISASAAVASISKSSYLLPISIPAAARLPSSLSLFVGARYIICLEPPTILGHHASTHKRALAR